ncbi:MAG: hypothetical protein V4793_41970 [Paraburkholderia tropica]|uniref:Phytanoyl-CoA dioxygenase n=1 Tax=Paraburkholderia tropica TaxID=92647 RepID=A0ABX5MUX1_9BURK|nr:hypothetical protein [Paraburkholderia tropica]MBB2999105.1 hypothetical protein [Paraburkholderia tropica]MBB6318995.1 hypothetical protein [Paraburkholderia tropica]MDE1138836.1 hypothetical protein [Paraburkholderia tropica]PXX18798.1 hypothetical protein C7400_104308 [Paraburkholderia tropica]PZW87330.1 hypothetical protein C7399_104307 [Paraburkholderia tropica]
MTATNEWAASEGFAAVSPASAQALARSMDHYGVGVLHEIVPAAILAKLRSFIEQQIEQHGGQYFSFEGKSWITGTCLQPLFEDAGLQGLLRSLYERKMRASPPSRRIFPVLRVLTGTHGLRHALNFHYDSYVVTVLIPILIPHAPGEPPGHLVMFPNLRNARRFAVVNILEKLLVEKLLKRLWRNEGVQQRMSAKLIPLTPGNLYFFWGMRSLHANQACLPTSVRSTVLLHFGDPHEDSVFKGLSQHMHARRLRRMARD